MSTLPRLLLALAAATATTVSHAQPKLEEVIVTAQKRAESLQDVPISVSALQGDKISAAGIANMSALADYIPNLQINEAPVNTNIYLRGMGSSNNQAFEQSVGMYIDGIYMGRGRQYRSPFMDLERVEVLRGPQGTLFGRNTVAGAINVITASPGLDEELNGNIALSAESNSGYVGEAMLSGAVTDNFALRGAFKYRETDGYVENTFLNQDEPAVEETVYRITAVWEVTDNLDVNMKYGHSDYERDGVASGATTYLTPEQRDAEFPNRTAFAETAYQFTDQFYPNFGREVGEDFTIFKDNGLGPTAGADGVTIGKNEDSSDNDTDNFAMNINYYMGDYTITSVTGWSEYNYVDNCDCDWLPLQFISRDDDQDFEQFSQEIRITSPADRFFSYIAGAYYDESNLKFDRRVTLDTGFGGLYEQVTGDASLLDTQTFGLYTAAQAGRDHNYDLDSDSWAVFGQGTFNLRDDVRLTVGLRYVEENKDVESSQTLFDDLTGIGVPSDNYFLGLVQATEFDTYSYDYNEDRNTDQWIPSANLQWDFNDDTMLYFTWSEGFKSGGFTGADDGAPGDLSTREFPCLPNQPIESCYDPTNPPDDFEFDDEEVTAWEIGGKHTLLDGAMTANWAAFYTEYDNLQTSIFRGISFGVTNAAEVEVKGIEFDLLWQATDGLRLGLSGAWLDTEYKSYADAPCTASQLDVDLLCGQPGGVSNNDLSGEPTTYAPDYTGTVFFDYSYPMDNGMELFAGGEANYSDEFFTEGDNDQVDQTDSYTKLNLRVGLRGADNTWEILVYGRNITDEQVYIYNFDVPSLAGSHASVIDEGEVYGARLRYSF